MKLTKLILLGVSAMALVLLPRRSSPKSQNQKTKTEHKNTDSKTDNIETNPIKSDHPQTTNTKVEASYDDGGNQPN